MRAPLLGLLLALAACAARVPVAGSAPSAPPPTIAAEPPRVTGHMELEGHLREGFTRPAVEALGFDVDSLPLAAWGPPAKDSRLSLSWSGTERYLLSMTGTVFAEVVLAYGSSAVFAAFTGGPFFRGMPPRCGPGARGSAIARWTGFSSFTDERMDVEMGDGTFDLSTCRAMPSQSVAAQAAAIVPGYVYGLRVKQDDEAEMLLLLMPNARMVSAAGDPALPLTASDTGAFTRLTFKLEPGSAGSSSVRLSAASLRLWEELKKNHNVKAFEDVSVPHQDLLVDVDVVAQGGSRSGTISFAVPNVYDKKPYEGLLAAARSKM